MNWDIQVSNKIQLKRHHTCCEVWWEAVSWLLLLLLTQKSLFFTGGHSVIITCLIPLGGCKIISVLLTMMLSSRGTTWSLRKAMTSLERKLFLRIQTVTMFNNHDWRNVTKRIRNFGVFYKQLFPVLTLHCEHLYWFDWKCKKHAWSCRKAGISAGKSLVFWEWLVC